MLRHFLFFLLITFSASGYSQLYHENYRPQYHLSPSGGWMGDPDGMVYHNGQYHILWWGHALSEDLVYWKEYNLNSMKGGPGGYGYWSGSVVVDSKNTAGFNTPEDTAMVAIYTMHYDNSGFEKVGLSISQNHIGFQYYEGNPVINTDQKDFRDPTVFWHEESNKWIMVITRSVERQIEFYGSKDLKSWTYLSKYDGKGAKEQVWEVPDLFELALNNNSETKKWVLTCGMGPNKMQYWVGDFDGTNFSLDANDNHNTGKNIPGIIFADFEGENYGDWTVTGTAFGGKPVGGTLPDQQEVNGFIGKSFINSYQNGDASTGKMISPDFTIEKSYINFLIGGGVSTSLTIKLVIDGSELFSTSGYSRQETLRWKGWNVASRIGQKAHIEIVDNSTEGWGHILLDQIVFSDALFNTGIENANWADWGKDFYAARSYRNYSDNPSDKTVWIGWMGNWDYARDVPTSPWKGCQSVPRSLELSFDENGYQLIQKPIDGLKKLRNGYNTLKNEVIDGDLEINGFQPSWNVYELEASFKIDSKDQVFGFKLADDGAGNNLIVGYDANTSKLFVDRRKAGTYRFNSNFPAISYAPTPFPKDSIMHFHIFMDQSSVEVFGNNYQTVLSSLVFTKKEQNGISIFSNNGPTTLIDLKAWRLKSIWGVDTGIEGIKHSKGSEKTKCYPNPLTKGELLHFKTKDVFVKQGVVSLYDLSGKQVFNEKISDTQLESYVLENLSLSVPKGHYIIHLNSATHNWVEKLIIL